MSPPGFVITDSNYALRKRSHCVRGRESLTPHASPMLLSNSWLAMWTGHGVNPKSHFNSTSVEPIINLATLSMAKPTWASICNNIASLAVRSQLVSEMSYFLYIIIGLHSPCTDVLTGLACNGTSKQPISDSCLLSSWPCLEGAVAVG